jgi:ABC-type multidrug transport system fused ATPase/permease subunit
LWISLPLWLAHGLAIQLPFNAYPKQLRHFDVTQQQMQPLLPILVHIVVSCVNNCAHIVVSFIGIGLFLCTTTFMCIWVCTGEASAKRLRERYLKAVLRQDIAFFDNVGAGEVTTRIQNDTREQIRTTSRPSA